jgi:hypothetical protein
MIELETENCYLRNLLTLATQESEDVDKILFNSEQHDMKMRYHVEQKKQQERAEELQRLRDEIQAELEKRFEERVIELEMFF